MLGRDVTLGRDDETLGLRNKRESVYFFGPNDSDVNFGLENEQVNCIEILN